MDSWPSGRNLIASLSCCPPGAGAATKAGRADAAAAAAAAADDRAAALHQPLLVEFALTLLHGALKKGLLNPRAPEAGALLDPLLPLLVRALK